MSMYNKIFTKILDSSIWLETDATRIVWMTMIAAMDETGFCQFASVANLAHRAIVDPKKAAEAVRVLESPDKDSSDPDNEGRRIERVPGGWIVLNAEKYRAIVTRAINQENTRKRVAKHRAKVAHVTECNADVTPANEPVTPSETETISEAKEEKTSRFALDCEGIYGLYPRKVGKGAALKAIAMAHNRLCGGELPGMGPPEAESYLKATVGEFAASPAGNASEFTPHPASWFNKSRYLDDPKEWQRGGSNENQRTSPSEQRRRENLTNLAKVAARRYGTGPLAANGRGASAEAQPDPLRADAGCVSERVGETGAEVRPGAVSGRIIEGHV